VGFGGENSLLAAGWPSNASRTSDNLQQVRYLQ